MASEVSNMWLFWTLTHRSRDTGQAQSTLWPLKT